MGLNWLEVTCVMCCSLNKEYNIEPNVVSFLDVSLIMCCVLFKVANEVVNVMKVQEDIEIRLTQCTYYPVCIYRAVYSICYALCDDG